MRGRVLVIGAGIVLAAFAGALWYFQTYAYYEELPPQPALVMGAEYPIEEWRGIDAPTSPLKLRLCLKFLPETAQRIADDHFELIGGEPLVAPFWFDCFDAKRIARDLAAHRAQLYLVGPSGSEGIEEMLALYPDGRGFVWRQFWPPRSSQ